MSEDLEPPHGARGEPGARLAETLAGLRKGGVARVRRFYGAAGVAEGDAGCALTLDGRPARTPARHAFVLPNAALARAVAAEWNGQGETIDPTAMPLTRMANSTIDGVAGQMPAVLAEVGAYFRSDLLFYRAASPPSLVEAQASAWDPVLAWARETFRASFALAEGVVFVDQPEATLAALDRALEEAVGGGAAAPFRLTALHVVTTLTGSALLALAVFRGFLSPGDAWSAAHVDETFQEAQWGEDAQALERRAARWIEMRAAATILDVAS